MRVLMTGGGTGGHVNPALAIAEIIKTNDKDSEIAFVGTDKGLENILVPKAGYKLYHIDIQGIKRALSLSNLKTAYLVIKINKGRSNARANELGEIAIGACKLYVRS